MPRLGNGADVVRIDEIRYDPAAEVVFGHAGIGERLPAIVLARGDGPQQSEAADFFVAAGVIDLVEFMTSAELGADRVPQQLHQLDPLDGRDAARASDVEVEIFAKLGHGEIARMRVQIDQAAGNRLLDLMFDLYIGLGPEHVVGRTGLRAGEHNAAGPRLRT